MADDFTIIRNGRLVDMRQREAAPVDILIEGDKICRSAKQGWMLRRLRTSLTLRIVR